MDVFVKVLIALIPIIAFEYVQRKLSKGEEQEYEGWPAEKKVNHVILMISIIVFVLSIMFIVVTQYTDYL